MLIGCFLGKISVHLASSMGDMQSGKYGCEPPVVTDDTAYVCLRLELLAFNG